MIIQPAIRPDVRKLRQEQILDAAQACFVRNGFHRTAVQDIAREAAMSAGNIYRYYVSKEAMIRDLAEREGEQSAALARALALDGGPRAVLTGVIRRCFIDIPQELAILKVDLWSEATRNPEIAAIISKRERERREFFVGLLTELSVSPDCDPEGLWSIISAFLRGLTVNRAILRDVKSEIDSRRLDALIDAGLHGGIAAGARI